MVKFCTTQPMYEELRATARDYALRMALLTSQATTSYLNRELSTAFNWFNNGLTFLRQTAGQNDMAEIAQEQSRMAEDCQDLLTQDVRNALQIAELTKSEMLHWQERWGHTLIRSLFEPYRYHRMGR
ncbi:MAG: hypothetical protein Kow006_16440 [Gammaproteobacteria bacterium]